MAVIVYKCLLFVMYISQVVAVCPSNCTCDVEFKVQCEDVGLDVIINNIPEDTKILEIKGGNITSLNNESFVNLTSLEEVSFENNQLRHIGENTFAQLTKLQAVKVRNNLLATVGDVFNGLDTLQDLEIVGCRLTHITNTTFVGLSLLKTLVLDMNRIDDFLPGTFDDLTSLEVLSVEGNRLTRVPPASLFATTVLKKLHLSSNEISMIERGEFRDFNHLEELYLYGLEAVKVGLPDDAFLGLEDTLVVLSISANDLTSTPSAVQNLTKLTSLDIANNKLSHLEYGIFAKLKGMERFYLSNNDLKDIPMTILAMYANLTELYLDNNKIETVPAAALASCSLIRNVYLEHNNISQISKDAFNGLNNLRSIDLSNNSLTALPEGIFSSVEDSVVVRLNDNPWVCDCRILWLSKWLRDNNNLYNDTGPYCQNPPNLKLRDLTPPAGCIAPNVTTETPALTASLGTNVTLNCDVMGYPTPDVFWITPHGGNVTMGTDDSQEDNFTAKYRMRATSLVILEAEKTDEGNFTCWGTNIIGNASVTVIVTVSDDIRTTSTIVGFSTILTTQPPRAPSTSVKATTSVPATSTRQSPSPTVQPKDVPPEDKGMSEPTVGMIVFSVCAVTAIGVYVLVHWICKRRNAEKDEEEQSLAFENRMFSALDDTDAGLI
ncbi:carboxypeptidase N subunit 2-like [Ptychodera flava]|uniref:carboxypeptidase N subunit 2-like n=1 Tax=Ptychodera flava TaxID=63121 RepID=UPI00396A5CCE